MQINQLEVTNIRNLERLSIKPSDKINFFIGNNGSGKTSLLESISLITSSRSFRTARLSNIQHSGTDGFLIFARIETDGIEYSVGYQKNGKDRKIKLNHQFINRSSELVKLFPIITFTPESLNLLTDNSKIRRAYIDRLLFHVKHEYQFHHKNHERALRQRNSQIRSERVDLISKWDEVLAHHGEWITAARVEIVNELTLIIQKVIKRLSVDKFDGIELKMSYGWDHNKNLQQALKDSCSHDIKAGYTTIGIQRADFSIRQNGRSIREIYSRGELKLLAFVLHLTQIIFLNRRLSSGSILLIDDLFSELDFEKVDKLFTTIRHFNFQTFITSTDEELIKRFKKNSDKLFHVKHGNVKEVL